MKTLSPWFFRRFVGVFCRPDGDFAKVGIAEVNADLATLVRTVVIVLVLTAFVLGTGQWSNPLQLPARTWVFLVLSALATGASWVCYFRALQLGPASQVAPVDKFEPWCWWPCLPGPFWASA